MVRLLGGQRKVQSVENIVGLSQGRRSAIIAASQPLPPKATGQGTLDERRRDRLSSGQSRRRPASQQRANTDRRGTEGVFGPHRPLLPADNF